MLKRFLLLSCFVMFLFQSADAKSITFAQLTDIHYSQDGSTNSSRNVSVSKKHLYFAVMSLNKKKPAFTVFLGDQIDKSNEDNIKEFMSYTSKLKMPYYFVLGNHDAHKMSGITKDKYLEIVSNKNPYQPALKKNYVFKPNKDIVCIVLDGSANLVPSAHGYYSPEQIAWIDKQLTLNKRKLVFIYQHCPLLPPHEHKSHEVIEPENYLKMLAKHKNVVLISSGHYHNEGFSVDEQGIRHISTTSLLNVPPVYDMVTVEYDKDSWKDAKGTKVEVEHVRV